MLEQEIASIIKFVLEAAGNPTPYYWNVPESFVTPAAYFPTPEIVSDGETFLTYRLEYALYVKFFNRTTEEAYPLALATVAAIRGARNLIPLIDTDGEKTGSGIRLKDPTLKPLDDGAVQVGLEWVSRRLYNYEEVAKMQTYDLDKYRIGG